MKRYIAAGALALCLSQAVQAAPSWPEAPYSYYAQNESLQNVLREFAGGFSLSLQVSSNLSGTVNGRFNVGSPTEFLDRLGGVYGFNWFVYAGTLFVSRASDMATRSISALGGSITSLRQALQQLGVLDPRFGWGELPEQSLALVSGPPQYVELIERTVAALPMGAGGQQVAVFRLRHASVNDRTVQYRDQQVTTPGLATVLRDLITGSGSGANNETLSAIAAPLREQPPVFSETDSGIIDRAPAGDGTGAAAAAAAATGGGRGGMRMREPTIQADTRLNAIIVQDIPDRIPIYRQLIEQLDVPSTLIEIEAMIVDVNSDRVSELGVTWGARAGSATFGYGDFNLDTSNGLPIDGGADPAPGSIGVSVGNMLVARLRALEGRGDANILSQPSILTSDNMGALIDLSETFYIQTRGERVATVTPITVGTSLRVTPRYIEGAGGERVELTVDIEDGRIQDERQIDNLPTVRRSNISTLAVVGDGQTLLIGGYNNTQDSERIDKVPFLGDIPGLGVLFSSRSKTVQQRERLFLIRPRVVAVNGQVVIPPESEAARSTGQAIGTAGQFVDEAQRRRSRIVIEPPSDPRRVDTSQPALGEMPRARASSGGGVVRVMPESIPVVVPERAPLPSSSRQQDAEPYDQPWNDGP